jgi:hypothetical protein
MHGRNRSGRGREDYTESRVQRACPCQTGGPPGRGRDRATGRLDVAIIRSLVRNGVVGDRVAGYGYLVVDECHHLSARSVEPVARQAKARFVPGLAATVVRKDSHRPIIFMQCGPVRHRVDPQTQAVARPFEHIGLVQPTSFCRRTRCGSGTTLRTMSGRRRSHAVDGRA